MKVTAKWEVVAVGLYLVSITVVLGQLAARRILWYDELFTLYLARESPIDLLKHLSNGVDLNPPLSYWLSSVALWLTGNLEWAIRIPSIMGAWITSISIYLYVRQRRGIAAAWLAMPMVMLSATVNYYFFEARPYGLVIGWASLCLLAYANYTQAERRHWGWWTTLMVTMCLGIMTHYYFCLVVLCIGMGELIRLLETKRVDWAMVVGFLGPIIVLVSMIPLWYNASQTYTLGFWSQSQLNWDGIKSEYGTLIENGGMTIGILLFAVAAAAKQSTSTVQTTTIPKWELTLLLSLVLLPVIGITITTLLESAFHVRYTLGCVVGLTVLLAFGLKELLSTASSQLALACTVLVVNATLGMWYYGTHRDNQFRLIANNTTAFLQDQVHHGTVVMASPNAFLQQVYYNPDQTYNLIYVADPSLAIKHHYNTTGDHALLKLNAMHDVPLLEFKDCTQLVDDGEPVYYYYPKEGSPGWVMLELKELGYHFEYVGEESLMVLFRIVKE